MTRAKLKTLNENSKIKWFCDNTRVKELVGNRNKYTIRVGSESRCLVADTVEELRDKFFNHINQD